ncbi:MAG: NADH-quinone oxidoreductase subunit J [Limisphaerales bacterium]|nr:MAG: NADH-quinone oxidoreductase subunit J [Limisphaerales bacterium]KAG0510028.1 MAG: NADH-quinone oxidoreductase subunit J [Limisphaerales bacterium]TXT53082.1 MAG: NADH-quinone oxidoreductase subunit J [Limisphaerales bacterium]
MAFPDILFYICAFLTLLFGALVVANPFSRNPVTSAMFLVLTIISMSGLFLLLNAFFLATVQILVYAGAVMVLFLFVIMLLDLKEEQRRKINLFGIVTGTASVAGLGVLLWGTIWSQRSPANPDLKLIGDTKALGLELFTKGQFLLPFEIVSVLLLVAMVGVILLSKKELK